MSNQSRSDRSETNTQYRKSVRSASFNQQRGSSGAYPKPGGAGGPAPSQPISSNRSFKKPSNAQGGQSRASVSTVNSSDSSNTSTSRGVQNGAHVQPQLRGTSDAPVSTTVAKPTETPVAIRGTATVPKAPSSQSAPVSSDSTAPVTPSKDPGDQSKTFAFQFGSMSPVLIHGMQIPARTNSAPPNLDEQKRDQARHGSFRAAAPLPASAIPKQQLPRKDVLPVDKVNSGDAQALPKAKKETQALPIPPTNQNQNPSAFSMSGISMQIPFHQPPVSVPFGGPNQQMQSQGMSASPVQMSIPMPLPMGNNPPVQQQMFVQGLQHPMQTQGIMHQGQNLGYTGQIGPQLHPQLGNVPINMAPQYAQQQGGKFGGQRKSSVRITDPNTHKELRFDNKRTETYSESGSSGPRSLPSIPQSQAVPSFSPSHPINYFPNSFSPGALYFPTASSLPIAGGQIAPNSQSQRFNYPVSQGAPNVPFMNPAALGTLPVNKAGSSTHGITESPNLEYPRDVYVVTSSAPASTVHVTIRSPAVSIGEKVPDSLKNSSSSSIKGEPHKPPKLAAEVSSSDTPRDLDISVESSLQNSKPCTESSVQKSEGSSSASSAVSVAAQVSSSLIPASDSPSEVSEPSITNNDGGGRQTLSRSDSIKENQRKHGMKGLVQPLHQISENATSALGLTARGHGVSDQAEFPETVQAQTMDFHPKEESLSNAVKELEFSDSASFDAVEVKAPNSESACHSEISSADTNLESLNSILHAKHDISSQKEPMIAEETKEGRMSQGLAQERKSSETFSDLCSKDSLDCPEGTKHESVAEASTAGDDVKVLEAAEERTDRVMTSPSEDDRIPECADAFTSSTLEGREGGYSLDDKNSTLDCSFSRNDSIGSDEVAATICEGSGQQCGTVETSTLLMGRQDGERVEAMGGGGVSIPEEKSASDVNKGKNNVAKRRKKRKEILQKADAAGTTSDLYMAYKGPEEKKEISVSLEGAKSTDYTSAIIDSNCVSEEALKEDVTVNEKDALGKAEPDDWEDAADISTPKLENSLDREQVNGVVMDSEEGKGNSAKKYSRDFLLKFAEQFISLPPGFEITPDIEGLFCSYPNAAHFLDRDSYHSPGKVERPTSGGSRSDRRGAGVGDDDKWSKLSANFIPGRDQRLDLAYTASAGFRPGQAGNYGVLRNPRAQATMQYSGGILSGPMQALGPQGVMSRNSPDVERWQKAASFQQRGLIPYPQTPLQTMHKAEKKYEVGKVTDEEEAKQRQLKAILNKLTPQNFEKLFEQVKAVNIDNAETLTGVISQIFDKALMEPTFCEMYANFCSHLARELPDFVEDNEKITFKRLLLNKCQVEFERGEREEEEANKLEEEGEVKQSEEEREEKRLKARRRMLGNIRLIGELYKEKMLTERIMHECIKKLLGQYQSPDEENVEALCKLMSTIGEIIDHPKAKEHMDVYFDMMTKISNNMKLSSRVRFMLKDSIDLRKNKWQQRRKVEGPKKIEEVHRDAAQERQAQASRLGRGPGINPSARRASQMDFGPRGSTVLSSSNAQTGGFRGFPNQNRGFGSQDVRMEDRQSHEARTLPFPLPQRPGGDDSITLGPQGGLARGMSVRGPQHVSASSLTDISPSPGDSRRMTSGLNGYSSLSERVTKEDLNPRFMAERFAGPAEQSSLNDRNMNYVGREPRSSDRGFDRSLPTSPPTRVQGSTFPPSTPPERLPSEDRLRDMSMAAIREFYSARDEKEVALCIKDLNSPGFHSSMICLWVTDSFERKDADRDLLAKLLVNLSRSGDRILFQGQLCKGFESVLAALEDTVNDAPKAPEFMGRLLAKVVMENVVSLKEIGQLIYDGGEAPGSLRESGHAADVLGNVLEAIRSEKGESVLNEIRTSSNLRLETFRPPDPIRSRILEKFM